MGKYVYSSTNKLEDEQGSSYNIDLIMPIKVHWEVCEYLRQANYLLASQEHMADVQELYRKIFKKTANYAVFENDRIWLLRRSRSLGSS